MRRDSIVLGNNYILPGSDVGKTRPNANALVVGIRLRKVNKCYSSNCRKNGT